MVGERSATIFVTLREKGAREYSVTQSPILQLLDNSCKVFHSEWLWDRVIHSSLFRALQLLRSRIRSNSDDVKVLADRSVMLRGADHTRAFETIDNGHLDVHKDDIYPGR
jgi:hypothetical protein